MESKMKKRTLLIKRSMTIVLFAILIGGLIYLFLLPYIRPVKMKGIFIPYNYIMEDNHVTITRYKGDEEEVIIPEKILFREVTILGEDEDEEYNGAFSGNKVIKKVVIPNSVQKIRMAFIGCTNLEEVILPSSLKTISINSFAKCSSLKEIVLPEGLESIGHAAFSNCEQLEEITIPSTVQEIERIAFTDCKSLQTVTIPNNLSNINGSAFANTPWFDEQTEEFVTAGDNVLIKYNGNEKIVEIPENIKYLSEYNFSMKDRPTTELIPGRESIEQIIIPESAERIYLAAIFGLENLTKIVIKNDNTILDDDCIYDCENVTIVSRVGSTGQQYAEKYGIPWEELKE